MIKKNIETTDTQKIIITQVGGNLNLKGWDQSDIRFSSTAEAGQIEENEHEIRISCPGNCSLRVPHQAIIEIRQIGGHLNAKTLDGELYVGKAGGNVILKDIAKTRFEIIGGQLSAKRIRGDMHLESIGGSAVVHDVDGQFAANAVGANLHLQQISGGINTRVNGNAVLRFSPVSWQVYNVEAGGRIRCQLPEDAGVMLKIISGAQKIEVKRKGGQEVIREGEHVLALGDGDASVNLSAGGKVTIASDTQGAAEFDSNIDIDPDRDSFGSFDEFGTMAEEIAQNVGFQVEAQLEMLGEQLETQLSGLALSANMAGLSQDKARKLEQKMKRASERAAQRAEQAAERMQSKLDRKLASVHRKAARQTYGQTSRYQSNETDPVSEEERMLILQMLEEDKISVEQADRLLSSLEG
ncbi:MAG: hypothetical protein IZT55_06775 [Anaerolineae bacterium]|nr:hypothetical protein [Anaerolineae bacterium]